jgi:hypothetical protein
MLKPIITGLVTACLFSAAAQPVQEKGAIKNLCGCYEVDFKYAETFGGDNKDYKPSKPYHLGGTEYAVAEEVGDKRIVIQHLLVIDDSTVIKHWREDWEYEKGDWWLFNHDATYTRKTGVPAKGQWTQTVWEVDDAPRYQGSSAWISNNNKYYWENTTDAPLPRREYSYRSDYNVMQRTNRIYSTPTGWLHEQDNKKIIRHDGRRDTLLSEEKGYNNYIKVADSKCAIAATWWKEHREFWNAVRQSWDEVLTSKKAIHLEEKSDGLRLYQQLDIAEKEHLTGTALQNRLKSIVAGYITQPDGKTVATTSPIQ